MGTNWCAVRVSGVPPATRERCWLAELCFPAPPQPARQATTAARTAAPSQRCASLLATLCYLPLSSESRLCGCLEQRGGEAVGLRVPGEALRRRLGGRPAQLVSQLWVVDQAVERVRESLDVPSRDHQRILAVDKHAACRDHVAHHDRSSLGQGGDERAARGV